MDYLVKLADTSIRIHSMFPYSKGFCREFFTEKDPEYEIYITNKDIGREHNRINQTTTLRVNKGFVSTADYLETMAIYRKVAENLIEKNVLPVNGILMQMDNKAVLFIGEERVGKRTHAAIWSRIFGKRVRYINDKKPLLRVKDTEVVGYGSPWSSKDHRAGNYSAPLAAICLIRQGSENSITNLPQRVGYAKLYEHVYQLQKPQLQKKERQILSDVIHRVAVYELICNMQDEAAIAAAKGMGFKI